MTIDFTLQNKEMKKMIIQDATKAEFIGFSTFRKKVTIEAVRMKYPFTVETLEGRMEGKTGDWLAVGVQGERYIIDHEVMRKSYVRC